VIRSLGLAKIESMTMRSQPTESALLIPVPAAEPTVQRWRERLDPACRLGVPAHVTLLYPFVAPAALDDVTIERLADLFSQRTAFAFSLRQIRWFGNEVAYVAPEPGVPFRALTDAICGEFPAYPPYRGEHDDVIPHLTIGEEAPVGALREAAKHVAAHLPIETHAEEVWLMTGTQTAHSWVLNARFELGGGNTVP
jgi:2'-5' RNA ligase